MCQSNPQTDRNCIQRTMVSAIVTYACQFFEMAAIIAPVCTTCTNVVFHNLK